MLDTNVLMSGLPSPYGPPVQIVDLIVQNSVRLVCDDRMIVETGGVLKIPKFGLSAKDVGGLNDHIRLNGTHMIAPPGRSFQAPDQDDLASVELAAVASVGLIVMGTPCHFLFLRGHNVKVMTLTQFLASL